MRIVMISPTVGDSFGTERIISQSAAGLTELGHEVFLIAERQNGIQSASYGGFFIPSLFSLPHLFTPLRLRKILKTLKTYLASVQPDIIHLMDQPHHAIIDFLNANYPTVLTAHSVAPTCPASHRLILSKEGENQVCNQPSGWKCVKTSEEALCLSYLKNDLHRWHALLAFQLKHQATKRLPRLIAISDYIGATLVRDGFDNDKITRIYNPVEIMGNITPIENAPKPLIVSACRLVPLKGIHVAINALKRLEDYPWTYWICGAGPEEITLKRWVTELGLDSRIKFLGQTSRSQTLRAIKSAQVFLQSNVGPEGFGLSVAEALTLGTPTITSQLPAFDEMIVDGQTGLLTPPGDELALAEAIQKLLLYPEIGENLSAQARITTPKHFSLEAFLSNLINLYAELTKEEMPKEVSTFSSKVME